jgi:[ribosomal protein S5]-alanine N-acetyltransferase
MKPTLQTQRLTLREFEAADLDELAAMVADEEQMHFYPRPKTTDEAAAWLRRNIDHYEERGFGAWRVEDRATATFAGYCGIRPLNLDGDRETEILWHIDKTFWRRGLATEAAVAVRDAAFRSFGLLRLVAIIVPDHLASRRVAEKIGMALEGATTFEDDPVVVYAGAPLS